MKMNKTEVEALKCESLKKLIDKSKLLKTWKDRAGNEFFHFLTPAKRIIEVKKTKSWR